MKRTLHVTLTETPRGVELDAVITLCTIRPFCLDYTSAVVMVLAEGEVVRFDIIALTDESALRSIGQWFVERFDAKAVVRRAEFWSSDHTA